MRPKNPIDINQSASRMSALVFASAAVVVPPAPPNGRWRMEAAGRWRPGGFPLGPNVWGNFDREDPTMNLKAIGALVAAAVAVAAYTSARADDFAYEATNYSFSLPRVPLFGVVDLNTGLFTPAGSMSDTLAGLGRYGGTIYGCSYRGDTLYSINTQLYGTPCCFNGLQWRLAIPCDRVATTRRMCPTWLTKMNT
jgi:hypothetical protein